MRVHVPTKHEWVGGEISGRKKGNLAESKEREKSDTTPVRGAHLQIEEGKREVLPA